MTLSDAQKRLDILFEREWEKYYKILTQNSKKEMLVNVKTEDLNDFYNYVRKLYTL